MLQESVVKETEMHRIIQIHFLSLADDCQKLLRLFIKKIPVEEITRVMGFKTENYAKTRRNLCKDDLKKRVADDPRITKYLNYEKPN
jgi:hypothetical protein